MGKDKRHSNMYKTVHRDLLKEAGNVHLPSNKTHTPKTAYKRGKQGKRVNLNQLED